LANRHETLPHDWKLDVLYKASPKSQGGEALTKKFRAKNMQNIG